MPRSSKYRNPKRREVGGHSTRTFHPQIACVTNFRGCPCFPCLLLLSLLSINGLIKKGRDLLNAVGLEEVLEVLDSVLNALMPP